MQIIKNIEEMKSISRKCQSDRKSIGFVPTMGSLHQGHLSLVAASQKKNNVTIVSIFINPKQFDNKNDLKFYPRTEEKDCVLLKNMNVDFVFIPDLIDMYPSDFSVFVDVPSLSKKWCGAFRRNHFPFVCVVVLIFSNIVKADDIYFGEKDYQQMVIIRKLFKDLMFDTQVISSPTIREKNGLAMSSRNQRLTQEDRENASFLFKTLTKMKERIQDGNDSLKTVEDWGIRQLKNNSSVSVEYLNIVDSESLEPLKIFDKMAVILCAIYFKKVRLIDNILIQKEKIS